MKATLRLMLAVVAALSLTACSAAPAASPSRASTATSTTPSPSAGPSSRVTGPGSPGPSTPMKTGPDGRPFAVETIATLDNPWAMAFLPGTQKLAITLQPGRMVLRDQVSGKVVDVAGVPEVAYAGQGGLGDIVPGPSFATDRMVYLSWAEAGADATAGAALGRARLDFDDDSARLVDLQVIWRQTPKVTGTGHFSHRIAFSPDGRYLFVTSGERQKFTPAQDLTNNLGKVLRLNLDGTPAAGNPFADRGGVAAQIWSYGHRNLLGIAFDAQGNLWESEMGPLGGDEINLILPGRNYGWPAASNGSNYDGTDIPDHRPGDGFEAPKVWWNPSISPGSLLIYSNNVFSGWTGSGFVGALSGQALIRVQLDGTTATKAEQWDMGKRIRALAQAPDGSLWLLEDGSGSRLLRLSPVR